MVGLEFQGTAGAAVLAPCHFKACFVQHKTVTLALPLAKEASIFVPEVAYENDAFNGVAICSLCSSRLPSARHERKTQKSFCDKCLNDTASITSKVIMVP